MKILANFCVIDQAPYCELRPNAGSSKCWVWSALDWSDGDQQQVEQFALKFSSPELATKFQAAFNAAKASKATPVQLHHVASSACPAAEVRPSAWQPWQGYDGQDHGGVEDTEAYADYEEQGSNRWRCNACRLQWGEDLFECSVCEIARPGYEEQAKRRVEKETGLQSAAATFLGRSELGQAPKPTGFGPMVQSTPCVGIFAATASSVPAAFAKVGPVFADTATATSKASTGSTASIFGHAPAPSIFSHAAPFGQFVPQVGMGVVVPPPMQPTPNPLFGGSAPQNISLGGNQVPANTWRCSACRLIWGDELLECSVCEIPRPGYEQNMEKLEAQKEQALQRVTAAFLGTAGSGQGPQPTGFKSVVQSTGSSIFGAAASGIPAAFAKNQSSLFGATPGTTSKAAAISTTGSMFGYSPAATTCGQAQPSGHVAAQASMGVVVPQLMQPPPNPPSSSPVSQPRGLGQESTRKLQDDVREAQEQSIEAEKRAKRAEEEMDRLRQQVQRQEEEVEKKMRRQQQDAEEALRKVLQKQEQAVLERMRGLEEGARRLQDDVREAREQSSEAEKRAKRAEEELESLRQHLRRQEEELEDKSRRQRLEVDDMFCRMLPQQEKVIIERIDALEEKMESRFDAWSAHLDSQHLQVDGWRFLPSRRGARIEKFQSLHLQQTGRRLHGGRGGSDFSALEAAGAVDP